MWPVPTGSIGTIVSPEMDPPPTFLNDFNGISGNINGEGRWRHVSRDPRDAADGLMRGEMPKRYAQL